MRKPLVAANWKMNHTSKEAQDFAAAFRNFKDTNIEVLICPPMYLVPQMKRWLEGSTLKLGAQNMHFEPKGAFTGEHSAMQLKDAGCEYAILGHSERRTVFREDDSLINKKVLAALDAGLSPILCVGETGEERKSGATFRVVRNQLVVGLNRTTVNTCGGLVVAYEPVWAIGTGVVATPEQAQEAHAYIRQTLQEIYNFNVAKEMRVIYGGSVTPENASDLRKQPDVDGFLVGGASLVASKFDAILASTRSSTSPSERSEPGTVIQKT